MEFWNLEIRDISMCCWTKYENHKATEKMYSELDELFDDGTNHITAPISDRWISKIHYYVFHTLENPAFSCLAKVKCGIHKCMHTYFVQSKPWFWLYQRDLSICLLELHVLCVNRSFYTACDIEYFG